MQFGVSTYTLGQDCWTWGGGDACDSGGGMAPPSQRQRDSRSVALLRAQVAEQRRAVEARLAKQRQAETDAAVETRRQAEQDAAAQLQRAQRAVELDGALWAERAWRGREDAQRDAERLAAEQANRAIETARVVQRVDDALTLEAELDGIRRGQAAQAEAQAVIQAAADFRDDNRRRAAILAALLLLTD